MLLSRFLALPGSAIAFALLFAAPAQAQAIRFISTLGSDSGACTLGAPCKTLKRGINMTPVGGELRVLDSGEYGPGVTIAKSMTIDGNGNTLLLNQSPAVAIDDSSAVVTLRKLVLSGGQNIGIAILAATAVHIEECDIGRFAGYGIYAGAENAQTFVKDTASHDNQFGLIQPAAAIGSKLDVDGSRFFHNGSSGVVIAGEASISRTVAFGNGANGIEQNSRRVTVTLTTVAGNLASGFALGFGELTIERSVARGSGGFNPVYAGLLVANAGATARISHSVFTNNAIGIKIEAGARVETRGNNTVAGNSTDVTNSGALVTLPPT